MKLNTQTTGRIDNIQIKQSIVSYLLKNNSGDVNQFMKMICLRELEKVEIEKILSFMESIGCVNCEMKDDKINYYKLPNCDYCDGKGKIQNGIGQKVSCFHCFGIGKITPSMEQLLGKNS